mmetsp:Transcript_42902/g.51512  ORF Transcript_42902/g.51512 Transcript_42902/m.51512 type:complete len:186 (+) Transcript_42902:55-612(+)
MEADQCSSFLGKDYKDDCVHRKKIRKVKARFMEVEQLRSNPNIAIVSVCTLAGQCPTYSGSIENDSDLQKPIQINSSSEIPTIEAQKLYVEISDMSRPKSNNRSRWFDRYEELVSYVKEFGHARVPKIFADNPALGNWVNKQRRDYKKFQPGIACRGLTGDKIRLLNKIGFEWNKLRGIRDTKNL